MTAMRLMSLPTHAALELAAGIALMFVPFVVGFSPAGLVASVTVGVIIVGFALWASTPEGNLIPVTAHFAYDRGMLLGLLVGALLLGLHGDRGAALALGIAAIWQLALNTTTRYSQAA